MMRSANTANVTKPVRRDKRMHLEDTSDCGADGAAPSIMNINSAIPVLEGMAPPAPFPVLRSVVSGAVAKPPTPLLL